MNHPTNNIIDIHSHILPKLDDGSHSIGESLEMLRSEMEAGIQTIAATPHFYPDNDNPEDFLKRRNKSFDLLKSSLDKDMPKILLGAEVAYFEGIRNCEMLQNLAIESTRLILIEMPNSIWTNRMISEILYFSENYNLIPLIAHIDRYNLNSEELKLVSEFVRNGGMVQANAQALLHFTSYNKIINMIRNGTIHFLGSDCHNMVSRPPKLGAAVEKIIKKSGSEPIAAIVASQNRIFGNDTAI